MINLVFCIILYTVRTRNEILFCSFGGGGDLPTHIHDPKCNGSENSLINCTNEVYTYFYCDDDENVGIICYGMAQEWIIHCVYITYSI